MRDVHVSVGDAVTFLKDGVEVDEIAREDGFRGGVRNT